MKSQTSSKKQKQHSKYSVLSLIQSLLPIRKYNVIGHSMLPTLSEGDMVIISTLVYRCVKPKVGDIVAVKKTGSLKIVIKRITEITVNGTYVILGDNRRDSFDSRQLGEIQKSEIVGKMIGRIPQ